MLLNNIYLIFGVQLFCLGVAKSWYQPQVFRCLFRLQHQCLDTVQECGHGRWNGLEIVQVSLLVTCGQLAKKSSTGVHQVGSGFVMCRINDEKLLGAVDVGSPGH